MKDKRTVKRSRATRKQGRTDWRRLRQMTEADIARAAADDADNPPWTDEELRNAQLVLPANEAKVPVSIRLDREVIDFFKEQGAGYQSRISAVLLSYVRTRRPAARNVAARSSSSPAVKRTAGSAKKRQTRR
jgi:uncharacterized protein (DUF4415 family)